MKNIKDKFIVCFAVAALFLLSATISSAQRVEFGVRFMPTYSNFDLQTSSGGNVNGSATLGFGVGALLGYNFSKHIGVQGEIIYSSLAQKYKEQDVERKVKLKYVNIPLLLSLNTGKTKMINLNIVAGPQIGVSVGSSLITSGGINTDSTQAVLAVKKGDLGFAYGVGLDFGLNPSRTARLGIGFRGVLGMLDISDNSGTISNNAYYILDRSHIKTNAAYIGFSFLF